MRKLLFLLLIHGIIFASGCVSTPSPATSPQATATRAAVASPTAQATATATPGLAATAIPAPTATASARPMPSPEATPAASPTPVPFFLEVAAPEDESVLASPSVDVKGRTVPDAVVSVNGELATVEADGSFTLSLSLEEGPNAIEVVASDFQGNEAARILTVIYVP